MDGPECSHLPAVPQIYPHEQVAEHEPPTQHENDASDCCGADVPPYAIDSRRIIG